MLNRVIIMGRFTRDPEIRHTTSGTPVVSFSLAVVRNAKKENGERSTDFIDCVAWRDRAEFVERNFVKGSVAVVEGSLETRDWVDKAGRSRHNVEVYVDAIYYYGEGKGADPGATSGDPNLPTVTWAAGGLGEYQPLE